MVVHYLEVVFRVLERKYWLADSLIVQPFGSSKMSGRIPLQRIPHPERGPEVRRAIREKTERICDVEALVPYTDCASIIYTSR